MDWLNIHTSTLDSPAFVGSGPVERSSWLCLLRFCIGQENGGRIADAKAWKDRQWQQLARVTLREVMAKSQLWTWEGNDLVVSFYPTSKESEVKARREVARRNGMLGGRPERTNVVTHKEPTSVNSGKAEGEWKGKGMEGINPAEASAKGASGELFANPEADFDPVPAPKPPKPKPEKKPREQNETLNALATVGGGIASEVPASRWSAVQKCLREIKEVCPEVTAEEIQSRARNYRRNHPDWTLTPEALTKHWATCGMGQAPAGSPVRVGF